MESTLRFFPQWTGIPNRSSPTHRSAASGEDGGEFGLDFSDGGQEMTSPPKASDGKAALNSYGSVSGKKSGVADLAETTLKMHASMQQVLGAIALFWILTMAASRIHTYFGAVGSHGVAAPSPAPGMSSAPTCAAYRYPQCEAAIRWYLGQTARTRCEAYERVKAEGDYTKFPYSATQQDTCTEPGCCGCAGQCSRCPPLLADCTSWRLDGTWRVAFQDGAKAKYTFDAHGHVEAELTSAHLPVKWKEYEQSYVPQGNDVLTPEWSTLHDARKKCRHHLECKSVTYDAATKTGENYFVYFKGTAAFAPGPGTGWVTLVENRHPELHGSAAVAGPLTQVSSDAPGTFHFDLHKAAPSLFPEGSTEQFAVVGDELMITRHVHGMKKQTGVGVLTSR